MNALKQITSRTVPGYVNVLGTATNTATVSLWSKESTALYTSTTRKGDYFRGEMPFNNATGALWLTITNVAALSNYTGADIVTNIAGSLRLAKTPETFTYDADGNLTSDSLWTNTWNGENRRITVESRTGVAPVARVREQWTLLVDGRWIERIVSTNNGTSYYPSLTNRYVWDNQVLLAVLDHTNGVVVSFLRGLDLSGSLQGAGGVGGVLAVKAGPSAQCGAMANTTHFTCYDGNGNVTALMNAATGEESARYEYAPFAERLRETGPLAKLNPIRFSTQYADDVTGDVKYPFRDYDADAGRWLSRDPMEERGGANLYAFVNNAPTWKYDYLGLWTKSGVLKLICKCRSSIPKDCLSKSTVYSYDKFIVTWDEYEKNPDGSKGKPKPNNPHRVEAAGASGGGIIYLKNGMSDEEAAATLVHECEHQKSTEKDRNKQEVDVQVAEEQYRIDCGLPPMFPGSRTKLPDGREVPNRAAIEKKVNELYGNVYNQDPNVIQENFKEDVQGKKLETDWKCP